MISERGANLPALPHSLFSPAIAYPAILFPLKCLQNENVTFCFGLNKTVSKPFLSCSETALFRFHFVVSTVLEVPLNPTGKMEGALQTPPAGSGTEPQPTSNLVHSCLKA